MRFRFVGLAVLIISMPALAAKNKGLVVPLKTSTGQDAGTATFKEVKGKLEIKLAVSGLPPGEHGFHIHQKPLCEAPDFKSAGPHFDPVSHQHNNVTVQADGTGKATIKIDFLSMGTGQPNDILANGGTSIMLHEKADDMKSDPTGNAGNRIACGVIPGTP